MLRKGYVATLIALQFVLLVRVAPRLGLALHADAALSSLPGGFAAMAQVAGAAMALVGAALVLMFPGVALMRHQQRGPIRFCGLPRWAVHLALGGGAILGIGILTEALLPLLSAPTKHAMLLLARPLQNAGIALAAAGALCAELLRRSIGPLRATSSLRRPAWERIEVTHPPELRTYGL